MKKAFAPMDVTKLFETRTVNLNGGYFCDIVHDTDEKTFEFWMWKDRVGIKMFCIGLPEKQPETGESFGWDDALEEGFLEYIYTDYVDLLDEMVDDYETISNAKLTAAF